MSQNASFSQSKKKQIEALNLKIDSMNQVLTKEQNAHKISIGSLQSQESKSKLKVDSLTKEIKSIEKQISTKQNDKQIIESEISRLKMGIENKRDSLTRLTIKENKTQINFKTVEIGNQTWMAENLNVSTFRNGDIIPEAKTAGEWERAGSESKPAWCYYNNDPENGKKYGKLYNGFAVNDPRGLAPEGWHIPSEEEWNNLEKKYAGNELKSEKDWKVVDIYVDCKNCLNWKDRYNQKNTCSVCKGSTRTKKKVSGNGNNLSGFSGKPSGYVLIDGLFYSLGYSGYYWCSENIEIDNMNELPYIMLSGDGRYPDGAYGGYLQRYFSSKKDGFSVRCIKD